MAYQVGYFTELDSLQFSDAAEPVSTFMAMPYGEYEHPVYGKLKLTKDKALNMVRNISERVRGTDLDIDYDHKMSVAHGGAAAGWVQAGEARDDGLWLTVKWTKKAYDAIKAGEWRYFSPEYHDEWKHPQTKAVHKDVLFGGGITNRPFLKNILPLNLSELSLAEEQVHKEEEGTGMDPKKLRKLLGLPEDATDEQVSEALNKVPDDHVIGAPPQEPEKKEEKETQPSSTALPVAASEGAIQGVIKRLSESTDQDTKALAELIGAIHTQNVQLGDALGKTQAALHLSETAQAVQRLSEGEGVALPAGTQKLLSEALLTPSQENVTKLTEAFVKHGVVNLTETGGSSSHGGGDSADGVKRFTDAVQKVMSENDKMDYASAVNHVALSDPDSYRAYRQASYIPQDEM